MLKKYFVEAIVWMVLIATIVTSVVMTFKVRHAKETVDECIALGAGMAQQDILNIRLKDGTWICLGYAIVREDLKPYCGWCMPEIKGDGYFLIIDGPEKS
jgi:hypothetical protein